MMRQKQVDEAIARGLAGKLPSGKVKVMVDNHTLLTLHHYHHLLLRFNLKTKTVLHCWHEKPTDKRILDAAIEALNDPNGLPFMAVPPKRKATPAAGRPGKRSKNKCDGVGGTVGTPRSSVKTVVGEEVEEKSSRFLAIVAFPVADRREANVALSSLVRRVSLVALLIESPPISQRMATRIVMKTVKTVPVRLCGQLCGRKGCEGRLRSWPDGTGERT